MKTSSYMWKIVSFRRWLFGFNVLIWMIIHVMPVGFGLLIREFFNHVEGAKAVGWDLWVILLGLIGIEVVRAGLLLYGSWIWNNYWLSVEAYLRKNLLDGLLRRPGAKAMRESPGEAISRFRD